jgi:hypothetical protein
VKGTKRPVTKFTSKAEEDKEADHVNIVLRAGLRRAEAFAPHTLSTL